jgi:hypothetical protein
LTGSSSSSGWSGPAVESTAEVVGGDPASCSALGGALRRQASTLRERRTALWHSATGLHGWTSGATDTFTERLRLQLADVDRMVGRLDEIGGALQSYASDLAHARTQGADALGYATRNGLAVDEDGLVRPRRGPLAVEVALRRRDAMPLAQHRVDVALGEGRAAAERLRGRTASALQGLRIDAGRLAGLDPTAG